MSLSCYKTLHENIIYNFIIYDLDLVLSLKGCLTRWICIFLLSFKCFDALQHQFWAWEHFGNDLKATNIKIADSFTTLCLLTVSMTPGIKPCAGMSSIQYWYHNTGDNLSTTKAITYRWCYWHLRWNSGNNTRLPTPQSEHLAKTIIWVYIETQQHLKKIWKNFLSQNIFHLSPVLLTSVIVLYFRISSQIFIQIWNGFNEIPRGPGGKWFMNKTLSRKARVRLPLRNVAKVVWNNFSRIFLYCS